MCSRVWGCGQYHILFYRLGPLGVSWTQSPRMLRDVMLCYWPVTLHRSLLSRSGNRQEGEQEVRVLSLVIPACSPWAAHVLTKAELLKAIAPLDPLCVGPPSGFQAYTLYLCGCHRLGPCRTCALPQQTFPGGRVAPLGSLIPLAIPELPC